jgi:hypothetical protein
VHIEAAEAAVGALLDQGETSLIVVGGGTGSKAVVDRLASSFPGVNVLVVEEAHTTERARRRYWVENPPRGWRRFVPRGMLTPPEPYDDLAAVLLAETVLAELQRE